MPYARMTVEIPEDQKKELQLIAINRGSSMSDIVRWLIQKFLVDNRSEESKVSNVVFPP